MLPELFMVVETNIGLVTLGLPTGESITIAPALPKKGPPI
jgi:hypothetical protein